MTDAVVVAVFADVVVLAVVVVLRPWYWHIIQIWQNLYWLQMLIVASVASLFVHIVTKY